MATSEDIAGYAKYLKTQGASDQDIQGYTKYLSDQHGVDHPASSIAQTALEHFGNGASLGYLPQLQAGAEKIMFPVLNVLTGNDVKADDYVDARDQNAKRLAQEAKDNPITAKISNLAGGITTGIATSGLLPEAGAATTLAGKVGQGALTGAKVGGIYGALANPGDIQGQISPLQLGDRALNAGKGALAGGVIGGVVPVLSASYQGAKTLPATLTNKLTSKLGQSVEFTPSAQADAVKAAADKLGIPETQIPKAVLTDNPTYQDMESGLSQSGSLVARPIRQKYNDFFNLIDSAKNKIADTKTSDSKFSLGKQIQDGLTDDVNAQRAPVSEMYQDMAPDLQKVPVNKGVVNKVFGQLKKNPLFQNQQGQALLDEHKAMVLDQPELNSLKEMRSTVRDSLTRDASDLDSKRVDALANAITKVRDNSVEAMKADLPPRMHGEVDSLINQITLADRAHASNINDVNAIKGLIGNKSVSSPGQFIKKLSDMSEEDLAKRAANLDTASMQALKQTYPSVFEKVQQAKVNDMMARSTHPVSGFNDNTFLKQYQGMGQEMKDLVFHPDMQAHIDSLQTLKQNIPNQLGPSGTPKGIATMEAVSPRRNVLDFATKKILDGPAAATAEVVMPGKTPESKAMMGTLLQLTKPGADSSNLSTRKSATDDTLKGSDKWAQDGLNNLNKHDPSITLPANAALDPKIKDLLVQASDLKPGSKAMETLLAKIKAKVKN